MHARKLRRAAERARSNSFLLEGQVQLREALEAGLEVTEIFVAEGAGLEGPWAEPGKTPKGTQVWHVAASVLKTLADTTTPQGIVAVVRIPKGSITELENPTMVVVLADVRDPGNAGTLIRTAAAAGANAIVFPKGSVDPFAPKTVRAASGALFNIPVIRGPDVAEVVSQLKALGLVVVAADAHGGRSTYAIDLTRPLALVLGNEAWGLPRQMQGLIDERVTIPMPGSTESLNVGIAGSIILFEAVRQRAPTSRKGRALS